MPDLATPLGSVIREAADRLAAAGHPSPRALALRVYAELTGSAPGAAVLGASAPADPAVAERYRSAITRIAAGEPVQYAIGTTGFRRLVLLTDRRALIPRPETEGLVDLALSLVPTGRALDLGTGSGCVALALADEGRYHDVTAVDRSPDALALARENGVRTGLSVRWLEGDWCAPVRGERFDLVVSNPPYLTAGEWAGLAPAVRDWEPAAALASGVDGLADLRRLLAEVPAMLAPGGWLVMEIDSTRGAASAAEAHAMGWTTVRVTDDLFGRPRFLAACREAHDAG